MRTVPHLPIPKGAAVILNTGSTNTPGYRIVVSPSGEAQYIVDRGTPVRGSISTELAFHFFSDLRAAMPLSKLPTEPCMKSASFGTSTFIWWQGQRSPDVSCPGNAAARTLDGTVVKVIEALDIRAGPPTVQPLLSPDARQLPPNEPRKPLPPEPTPPS